MTRSALKHVLGSENFLWIRWVEPTWNLFTSITESGKAQEKTPSLIPESIRSFVKFFLTSLNTSLRSDTAWVESCWIIKFWLSFYFSLLKGSVCEKWNRFTAKDKRFWSLLILLLSVASIRRKLLKTTYTKERTFYTNSESCNLQHSTRKKINLIPNKSFRYYNQ